ncbi:MAG: glucose-6-phosphate isomerase, partial [Fusobacteriaceae bacterium]|nr:glucose-6-phosphate isomerase [Fusobacteriaceae bacterium]
MERLKFNYQNALNFINEIELSSMEPQVALAAKMLEEKTGNGNEFLGWLDFHKNYDKEEFKRVQKSAEKIKNDSEILLVIGIGGSYLGARAAIEFLTHTFYNNLEKEKRATPKIIFVGQNISGTYLTDLLDLLGDKEYSINVISKSGTTTEPALAFRVLKNHMEKKYGKEGARARIFATTDKSRGALKKL